MRYVVGFVLGVAIVGSPLGVRAEESFAPKPYLELELDSEVTASQDQRKLVFLIPRHLQKRIPGGADAEFGLEYKKPEPSQERSETERKRRRRLGLGIGLGVGLPLVGLAIGWAAAAGTSSFE